jgi:hypothetical protein
MALVELFSPCGFQTVTIIKNPLPYKKKKKKKKEEEEIATGIHT